MDEDERQSEAELCEIVGGTENPALALRCREVLARGEHEVMVSGPHLEVQASAVHNGYWGG